MGPLDVALGAMELERLALRVFLGAVSVAMARRAWAFGRHPARPLPALAGAEVPSVTVLLPIRNEEGLARRVIEAAAGLDYPRQRLEIQVLDDSDDSGPGRATRALIDATAAGVAGAGIAVHVVRRRDRTGWKGGNLEHGLGLARGELLAILDADAVPAPSFLREVVGAFATDPRLGMVQGRAEFSNRDENLLTRAQAILLDGLMALEQPLQSRRGRPLHFNGSGGVFRRACVVDAGGFTAASCAEDLDLSHRAALRGWRFEHRPEVRVAHELPGTMAAFRTQQDRWTRGKAQTLRGLVGRIAASPLSPAARLDLVTPFAGRLLFPFCALLAVTMPLTTFGWVHPLVRYSLAGDAAVLAGVALAATVYHGRATRAAGRRGREAVALVPVVFALLFGLSLAGTVALGEGLLRRAVRFEPTARRGAAARGGTPAAWIEVAAAALYLGFTALAAYRGLGWAAAFFAAVTASFAWVGTAALGAPPAPRAEPTGRGA